MAKGEGMTQRICRWCKQPFTPSPHAHWQKTCSDPECKKKQRYYENHKEVEPRNQVELISRQFSVSLRQQPIGAMVTEAAEFLRGRIKTMKVPKNCRIVTSLTEFHQTVLNMRLTYRVEVEKLLTGVGH